MRVARLFVVLVSLIFAGLVPTRGAAQPYFSIPSGLSALRPIAGDSIVIASTYYYGNYGYPIGQVDTFTMSCTGVGATCSISPAQIIATRNGTSGRSTAVSVTVRPTQKGAISASLTTNGYTPFQSPWGIIAHPEIDIWPTDLDTVRVPVNKTGYSVPVKLVNRGAQSRTANLSCTRASAITSCSVPSTVTIAAHDTLIQNVTVNTLSYTSSGQLKVIASTTASTDTSDMPVLAISSAVFSAHPKGQTVSLSNSTAQRTMSVIVENAGEDTDYVRYTCEVSGSAQPCTVYKQGYGVYGSYLDYEAADTLAITYTTSPFGGTGKVLLRADGGGSRDSAWQNISVAAPPYEYCTGTNCAYSQGLASSQIFRMGRPAQVTHMLHNRGFSTITLTPSCTITGVTCTVSPTSASVGAHDSVSVAMSFSVPSSSSASYMYVYSNANGPTGQISQYRYVNIGSADASILAQDTINAPSGTSNNALTVRVVNTSAVADTFAFSCTSATITCSISTNARNIALGDTALVQVSYTTTTPGIHAISVTATGSTTETIRNRAFDIRAGGVWATLGTIATPRIRPSISTSVNVPVSGAGIGLEKYAYSCAASGKISSCTISPTTGNITESNGNPAQQLSVQVTSSTSGEGAFVVTAASGTYTDTRSYSVHVGGDSLLVKPDIATIVAPAAVSFAIENKSTHRRNLTLTCTRSTGATCAPSTGGMALAGGANAMLEINLNGQTTGWVKLFAVTDTATEGDFGVYNLQAPVPEAVRISPMASYTVAIVGRPASARFEVEASEQGSGYLECSVTGVASSCVTPGSVTLTGSKQVISVEYMTNSVGAGTISLGWAGTYSAQNVIARSAGVTVQAVGSYAESHPTRLTAGNQYPFKVKNTGLGYDDFRLTCSQSGLPGTCSLAIDSIKLAPGDSAIANVTFTANDVFLTSSLTATATGSGQVASATSGIEAGGAVVSFEWDTFQKTMLPHRNDSIRVPFRNRGTYADNFYFTCLVAGAMESCSIAGDPDHYLEPGPYATSFDTLTIRFRSADAGYGSIALRANGDSLFQIEFTVEAPKVVVTAGDDLPVIPLNTVVPIPFKVKNIGALADSLVFACPVSNSLTCVQAPSTITNLNPGAEVTVSIPIQATGAGIGLASLQALGKANADTATIDVVSRELFTGATNVETVPQSTLVRSDCVTTAAGQFGASQCGSLLYAYSLPAYRSMNRDRTLTLVYNSAVATGKPVIQADLRLDHNANQPDSIELNLKVGSVTKTFWYSGYGIGVPQGDGTYKRHRVSLPWDSIETGLFDYTLEAVPYYNGATDSLWNRTGSGTFSHVDRSSSKFGRGWALAGIDQIRQVGTTSKFQRITADGSVWKYDSISATQWVAPRGAFRDTITYVASATPPVGSAAAYFQRYEEDRTRYLYDLAGRLIWVQGADGQYSEYGYSSAGDTLKYIRIAPYSADLRYTFAYNGGVLSKITDPSGRATTFTRAGGLLSSARAPGMPSDTTVENFSYSNGLMTLSQSERGAWSSYYYAPGTGVLDSAKINTTGALTRYQSAEIGGLARLAGANRTLPLDPAGAAATIIDGPVTEVADVETIYVDRAGAPVRLKDALGIETKIVRDTIHTRLPSQIIYADGHVSRFVWNSARPTLAERRDSFPDISTSAAVTKYSYSANAPDMPSLVVGAAGDSTRYYYSGLGLADSVRAANGHVTKFEYFTTGHKLGLAKAISELNVMTFNPSDGTESLDTAKWQFDYGAAGNLASDTAPSGAVRVYQTDAAGRVVRFTDPMGLVKTFAYDSINQLKSTSEIAGDTLTTTFAYDLRFLKQVIDPRGVTRSYVPDASTLLGRVVAETDDYGFSTTYAYDLAGRIKTRVDRKSSTTSYTFDAVGRTAAIKWVTPNQVGAVQLPSTRDSVTIQYDTAGRPVVRSTSKWVLSNQYYSNGALKTAVRSNPSGGQKATISYGYDLVGRRTHMRMGTPGSTTDADSVWYDYAATNGLLQKIFVRWRTGVRDTVVMNWDTLGRRREVVISPLRGNMSVVTSYKYDIEGNLREVCSKQPDGGADSLPSVFQTRFAIDSMDLSSRVIKSTTVGTQTLCGVSANAAAITGNHYDGHGRLDSTSVNGMATSFSYDKSGNMTMSYEIQKALKKTFVTNPGHNRLQSYTIQHLADPYGVVDTILVHHDLAGSRDYEQPSAGALQLGRSYYYDGLGRTTGTVSYSAGNVWRGDGLAGFTYEAQNDIQCEYDGAGRMAVACSGLHLQYDGNNVVGLNADGSQAVRYVNGTGTDDPILAYDPRDSDSSKRYFNFVTDGQGRRLAVGTKQGVDASGFEAGRLSGAIDNARSFEARRDPGANAGLSFFRNRFYDTATRRWTQEDPIGLFGGVNLYAYVGNNPASYTDSFGLCPVWLDGKPCGKLIDSPMQAADATEPSGIRGSECGMTRSQGNQAHNGFDWKAAIGTPVHAPEDATVTANHYTRGGNTVVMELGNGAKVEVDHLDKYEGLSNGQTKKVKKGDIVGYTGTTGNAATDHRDDHGHVTTRVNGQLYNPRSFFGSTGEGGQCIVK